MDIITVPSKPSGSIKAIPSKSQAHRLLICAALCKKPTRLIIDSLSEDIEATMGCLKAIGVEIQREGNCFTVIPPEKYTLSPTLDCGESGSTLRFMLPVVCALCGKADFDGHGRLPLRPMTQLVDEMEKHGVSFSSKKLPFSTSGNMCGGDFTLPGNISSQYITGLLLALPLLEQSSRITITTRLESSAYVDITLDALSMFGVKAQKNANSYIIEKDCRYISPESLTVEGDWSNAAFFIALGTLCGGISVTGLNTASVQGDKNIISHLKKMGAEFEIRGDEIIPQKCSLHGCVIDISETPDLLPILAVVAAFAQGQTRFVNGERLRLKESDRLKTTCAMLNSLGGVCEETADGLTIEGKTLTGGTVDGANDHRIVMAAAIAAFLCKGDVTITGAQAVNKSYPDFFEDYNKLGGKANVI